MSTNAAVAAVSATHRVPVLLPSQLLPGDIIITASDTFGSNAVRWATRETVSHALIHCRDGLTIDASPGRGVAYRPVQRVLEEVLYAAVLRHKFATPSQCKAATDWALMQIGKPYDKLGAARIGLQPGKRTEFMRLRLYGVFVQVLHEAAADLSKAGHDTSFFCSELIAKAYLEAGVPLTDHPAYLTSPGQLLTASGLRYVGDIGTVT